jgi:squalene synthase HpnC
MAVDHYENFPVASLLLPAHLRSAVKVIYAFARTADDIADEGEADQETRLKALNGYDAELDSIAAGQTPDTELFRDLQGVITQYQLPITPFKDLISAFKQDIVTTRYDTHAQVLDYCSRSANPVGTLMLHLYKAASSDNLVASDAICSALQLINFLQDVAIDWDKDRIYLPRQDMQEFGIHASHIARQTKDPAWTALMQYEINRARRLMLSGAPLAGRLPGRIGWELRLVVQGGLRILERIEQANGDVFRHRPKLGPIDWVTIAWRACTSRIYR